MKNIRLPSWIAFTILFGIASIVGTFIWAYSQQEIAEPGGGVVVTRPPAASDELAETVPEPGPQDDFAGWQTYRNEEHGFEVRYPEDWTISEVYFPPELDSYFVVSKT